MKCSRCGANTSEKDSVCPGCGVKFIDFESMDFERFAFAVKERKGRPERRNRVKHPFLFWFRLKRNHPVLYEVIQWIPIVFSLLAIGIQLYLLYWVN